MTKVSDAIRFDYQSDRHCAKTAVGGFTPEPPFDYQSDRHCAKTMGFSRQRRQRFDYQSDRHCAKTLTYIAAVSGSLITSQIDTAPKLCYDYRRFSVRLITSQIDTAPKRVIREFGAAPEFDYQSDRHCAKTSRRPPGRGPRFDYQSDRHCAKTAQPQADVVQSLITSQIDTAPKLQLDAAGTTCGLITSQIDTAPKPRGHTRPPGAV